VLVAGAALMSLAVGTFADRVGRRRWYAALFLGLAAFAYLVVGRYGTPFVVAQKIGFGGLVFQPGRSGNRPNRGGDRSD